MLTFYVGLRNPRLFRGLLPAGGWVEPLADAQHPLDSAGVRRLPIRAFNGAYDDVVNPDTTKTEVEKLKGIGVPAEALRYPAKHQLTAEMYDAARDFVWAQLNRDKVVPVNAVLHTAGLLTDSGNIQHPTSKIE